VPSATYHKFGRANSGQANSDAENLHRARARVVRYTTGMSKRLQVVVGDADMARYEHTARAAGLNLSEWVRQALGVAQREASSGDLDAKLAVIRKALSYETGGREVDIDTMLAETDAGRLAEIEAGLAGADDV
jgi:hypothetical protein